MANPIDNIFSNRSGLKLMTHVVAGYPDLETSVRLITVMAESGADLIEIQIPFSDPLADGPTISTANQAALDNGITPEDCFRLVKNLTQVIDTPLLFMTYANIAFNMGLEHFIQRSRLCGISGLIIPDLPFDENNRYREIALDYGCYPIPVVSPGMDRQRLTNILDGAAGFVYTTLRVGITGARKQIDERGLGFLDTLKDCTSLPIAAGFGISSADMVKQLENRADAAVIGSFIINLLDRKGIDAVGHFIRTCRGATCCAHTRQ
jgi:tryptophan synthase alpha chain